MKISANGLVVIKHFESLSLKAYPDPASGGSPWTIGWGHTGYEVKPGLVWTENQCVNALLADLEKFEKGVSAVVQTTLTQGQYDALVSFSFNLGLGNLQTSTLLKMVNTRDMGNAAAQFSRWNKAGGKVMKGLIRRRAAEAALFNGSPGQQAILIGTAAA